MPAPRTNAADPTRLLALLWQESSTRAAPTSPGLPTPAAPITRRGPRRGLEVNAVVRAAIVLADASGLDGLSMRRLATHLGIAPMSLYTYVPAKAELIDLMLDRLYLDMDAPPMASLATPRERVWAVASTNWDLATAHPWVLGVATTRPGLGPGATRKYDYELGAFDGLGLSDVDMDSWLTLLLTVVRGAAQLRQESADARTDSGESDSEWWESAGPALVAYLTPEAYPLATRVGTAAGAAHGAATAPEHVFRFGVERLLDALNGSDRWEV
ncbi:MAG: TetR/AcrR family transcriptional regulator C-terminal domain-containing protein [Bifidobacteriaceae bacterium]|jgi:AcrR family transcriptional regulator|nr:TetR/AcrR family transcriptional regulator C-terminal domain-containing protein [Bifidobacteriaceae bacterium]